MTSKSGQDEKGIRHAPSVERKKWEFIACSKDNRFLSKNSFNQRPPSTMRLRMLYANAIKNQRVRGACPESKMCTCSPSDSHAKLRLDPGSVFRVLSQNGKNGIRFSFVMSVCSTIPPYITDILLKNYKSFEIEEFPCSESGTPAHPKRGEENKVGKSLSLLSQNF
ncbi:hypothetical protein EVAR_17328_1 [Eumeta japonica]|uniref:Uncharacterized protein n=1 Tax=Eumeta variegata TaxID=151549 RepID=A0A4C1TT67_EUMVA|nr:hypothetical protein EVAR_17328_1 [Eumeta japonica]